MEAENAAWNGELEPGNALAIILVPAICQLAGEPDRNRELLTRTFAFLERLSESPDEDVVTILATMVLEAFWGHCPAAIPALLEFMGPNTRQMMEDMDDEEVEDWD